MIQTDILVVGSGAAGLFYALKSANACPQKKITIITKASPDESNTKYAQGGVAVVLDEVRDNFKNHIADTLIAGDGLCNQQVVEMVVQDAPGRIYDLIDLGVNFDLDLEGKYDMGREGGHSHHRVIHHKDNTGEAIEQVLLKKMAEHANISVLEYHVALELLLSDQGECIGSKVLDIKQKKVGKIYSKITVLATGGCGSVYVNTTNPSINTGDGIALASRAGAKVSNMQFIQFHPTVGYDSIRGKLPLVTEALRGAGARLRNINKELFMSRYDAREELAPRDIVSRAIYSEMVEHKSKFIYLDCTMVDREKLIAHFPNIYKDCKERGYDLFTDLLPIVPAAHYLCGGIEVDMDGKTSVDNLFAIGECSNTGLHGANRLASNSLLEALVYAHRAAMLSKVLLDNDKNITSKDENADEWGEIYSEALPEIPQILDELNRMMSQYVGIVRTHEGLLLAEEQRDELERRFMALPQVLKNMTLETLELRNMLEVCKMIISESIAQKENKGTFYNIDLHEI